MQVDTSWPSEHPADGAGDPGDARGASPSFGTRSRRNNFPHAFQLRMAAALLHQLQLPRTLQDGVGSGLVLALSSAAGHGTQTTIPVLISCPHMDRASNE